MSTSLFSDDSLSLPLACAHAHVLHLSTFALQTSKIAPIISDYWERAAFPFELVPGFQNLNIGGGIIPKEYGGQAMSWMGMASTIVELARVDGSCSTFFLVHCSLAALNILMAGSEKQKRELLPELSSFRKVGAWALTEPTNGSDASALQSTARKVPGGWILNGKKRWIGNATWSDIVVYLARNEETNQINAFIVRKGNPGFRTGKIEQKIALRCVQNADIELVDCFIPDEDRLPGVESFKDTNKVLAVSRVMVAWQPIGLAVGAYDQTLRYVKQRTQFGAPLAANQLVQERLTRMLGSIQAAYLSAWRLTRLAEAGRVTHEQASLVKAFTTLRMREVVALGRELLGGNGIVAEFGVAKAFCDLEAYYTYEGTYDVNALVSARGQTGISAFKTRAAQKK